MDPWQGVDQVVAAVAYVAVIGVAVTGLPVLAVVSLILARVRGEHRASGAEWVTRLVGGMVALLVVACVTLAVAD